MESKLFEAHAGHYVVVKDLELFKGIPAFEFGHDREG